MLAFLKKVMGAIGSGIQFVRKNSKALIVLALLATSPTAMGGQVRERRNDRSSSDLEPMQGNVDAAPSDNLFSVHVDKDGKITPLGDQPNLRIQYGTKQEDRFWQAIHDGNAKTVQSLLQKNPSLITTSIGPKKMLPFLVAMEFPRFNIIQILLEAGANPDARFKTERFTECTLLHVTAVYDKGNRAAVDMAKLLIKHGADIYGLTSSGLMAIELALIHGNWEMVSVLIEKHDIDRIFDREKVFEGQHRSKVSLVHFAALAPDNVTDQMLKSENKKIRKLAKKAIKVRNEFDTLRDTIGYIFIAGSTISVMVLFYCIRKRYKNNQEKTKQIEAALRAIDESEKRELKQKEYVKECNLVLNEMGLEVKFDSETSISISAMKQNNKEKRTKTAQILDELGSCIAKAKMDKNRVSYKNNIITFNIQALGLFFPTVSEMLLNKASEIHQQQNQVVQDEVKSTESNTHSNINLKTIESEIKPVISKKAELAFISEKKLSKKEMAKMQYQASIKRKEELKHEEEELQKKNKHSQPKLLRPPVQIKQSEVKKVVHTRSNKSIVVKANVPQLSHKEELFSAYYSVCRVNEIYRSSKISQQEQHFSLMLNIARLVDALEKFLKNNPDVLFDVERDVLKDCRNLLFHLGFMDVSQDAVRDAANIILQTFPAQLAAIREPYTVHSPFTQKQLDTLRSLSHTVTLSSHVSCSLGRSELYAELSQLHKIREQNPDQDLTSRIKEFEALMSSMSEPDAINMLISIAGEKNASQVSKSMRPMVKKLHEERNKIAHTRQLSRLSLFTTGSTESASSSTRSNSLNSSSSESSSSTISPPVSSGPSPRPTGF